MKKKPKLYEYTVKARIVLDGAVMAVEAEGEEHARSIAEDEPDFDTNGASLADWTVTSVRRD